MLVAGSPGPTAGLRNASYMGLYTNRGGTISPAEQHHGGYSTHVSGAWFRWRARCPTVTIPPHANPTTGDTGFVLAGTGADDASVGTVTWTNPGNITADDATNATASMTDPSTSHYIRASNFDFSSIPGGSTIVGIEVQIERQIATATCNDSTVRLFNASGVPAGDNKSAGLAWSVGSMRVDSFGGASDLWGLTPTLADVQDVDWGFGVSCTQSDTAATASVDYMKMKIYYSGGGDLVGGGFANVFTRDWTSPFDKKIPWPVKYCLSYGQIVM